MRKLLYISLILWSYTWALSAQTNTNGVITIGKNALYYEDYALSIQYFNQAIQSKPYLYEPYYLRAIAKYYLGDYQGSIEDCHAAIERDPFIDEIFKLRAVNFIVTEQFEKAIADYRHLISMEVDNKDIRANMVLCATQIDQLDEADKMLDTMIQRWPDFTRCYILKAQIAIQNKDTLRADTLLERALTISPHEVDAWAAKAQLLLQRGQYKAAEAAYDKAILQKPKEAGFYLNRATARFKNNHLRGAMEDYNVALDIDPDNYIGHYNRGLLRMQVGENNDAIKDFDFVLEKEPDDRLALFNRATLAETTGDYHKAIQDYTTVLKQYPQFLTGYTNRARCYRKIGNNNKALEDERKVYVAQLDNMFGNNNNSGKITRKKKEKDIDGYKKLVVDNDDDNLAKFYASDYRGRIQNKDVSTELQPLFFLSFTKTNNGLSDKYHYASFVEHINARQELIHPIYLSNRENSTSITEMEHIQQADAELCSRIAQLPEETILLFYHSVYLTAERNFTDALECLDKALEKDADYTAALFLRAVIHDRIAETSLRSSANPIQKNNTLPSPIVQEYDWHIKSAIQDLTKALATDDRCAYLYYNRACLYAKNKEITKALEDLEKAIQIDNQFGEAYYNRGILLIDNGNKQEGLENLSKAGEAGLYSAYSLIKHFRKQK